MTYHSLNHTRYPSRRFWGLHNPVAWLVHRLRQWLDAIAITSPRQARWICRLIPASCPFERDIRLGPRTVHIPALCRINPLYEQLIALRLRAVAYQTHAPGQPEPCSSQEKPSCP
ncbi:MAG: Mo-dependent nitrogenase C-terminal domain-containing protein [Thermostichus sp. DG02_5_bins_236]